MNKIRGITVSNRVLQTTHSLVRPCRLSCQSSTDERRFHPFIHVAGVPPTAYMHDLSFRTFTQAYVAIGMEVAVERASERIKVERVAFAPDQNAGRPSHMYLVVGTFPRRIG